MDNLNFYLGEYPKFIYYVERIKSSWIWNSMQEAIEHFLKEVYEYHMNYGKHGFLSEHTTIDKIRQKAERAAKVAWDNREVEQSVNRVGVLDSDHETQVREKIEKSETFIRWVTQRKT